jgi:hypothetical protein
MISRIGQARGRPVLFATGSRGLITAPLFIGQIALVSVGLADMLLSVAGVRRCQLQGWCQQALESRRLQPLNFVRNRPWRSNERTVL